ncbi:uncharacterized protein LOC123411163 isoform X5 [Hordeum vulgare subsp. vulgare]|uniref:uncharacterized protein LOC123411163 isoform X5 n=1 Tax=Hordeum vulgare subsp. vulgare TaxID=112509 RepID=UPI001D1A530D|nr:uncharacterized protein LOC123411163 isoform X5 [Hordeum vulgare subsp. vulgare]
MHVQNSILAETQHGVDLVGSVSLESPRPVKKRSTAPPSSKPPTYTTLSIRSTSDGSLLLPHDFLARYGPVIHPDATFSGTIIGLAAYKLPFLTAEFMHYSTRQKNGWLYTYSFYSHRLCSPALFDEATSPCSFHGMTAVHCIV